MIFPPALILIAGAVVLPMLPRRLRSTAAVVVPVLALVHLWSLPDGARVAFTALGQDVVPLEVDRLSRVFGAVFAIAATAASLYAWHLRDAGQQVAALVYAGAGIGVVFAGDLFSLLFFTEVMAVFSTYLIWARGDDESHRSGTRYLLVHLTAGAFLMGGILLHLGDTGTLAVGAMDPGHLASWLVLVGVAINAAVPPLHAWLPDAYPRATVTGAVFLSAFTTKSSVYVLIRMFAGWDVLIYLGVAMALYGVVYAVLANDIRGILAYHIVSQVGYMVAAVGIGTELALNGATAHAFSHILYKGLLFMGAGAVLHTTGRSALTELGGLYRSQRAVFWLYMIGAFSISGFPLFNGFISKSIVIDAAGVSGHETAMLLLLLASIGTFLHTGLKLPYWTWFGTDRGTITGQPAPRTMYLGMILLAGLCLLFGLFPGLLYDQLPFAIDYRPYTTAHLTETTQLLALTFAAFWLLRRKVAGEARIALDTDWVYRRPAAWARHRIVGGVAGASTAVHRGTDRLVAAIAGLVQNPPRLARRLDRHAPAPDAEYDPNASRPGLGWVVAVVIVAAAVLGFAGLR